MEEEFDTSADTSLFDDICTDITDSDSFSDSVDIGSVMDDIRPETAETEDITAGGIEALMNDAYIEALDETCFQTNDSDADISVDIESLMNEAGALAEDISEGTEDIPSDLTEGASAELSDVSDLMDEAAIDSSYSPADEVTNEMPGSTDTEEGVEPEAFSAADLPNEINYDEVFEGLDDYDFDGIDYASDTDRLDSSLDSFSSGTWERLTLDEQKSAINELAGYVEDVIGFDDPPEIIYYNNPVEGDYGGYSPDSNTLEVNEYMLYNNDEAADTVAHELWHAYQHQRASNPQSAKDFQYQYGFDNYIRYEDDIIGYQEQLVEAEARAFAQQFKDRLNMKGRHI